MVVLGFLLKHQVNMLEVIFCSVLLLRVAHVDNILLMVPISVFLKWTSCIWARWNTYLEVICASMYFLEGSVEKMRMLLNSWHIT